MQWRDRPRSANPYPGWIRTRARGQEAFGKRYVFPELEKWLSIQQSVLCDQVNVIALGLFNYVDKLPHRHLTAVVWEPIFEFGVAFTICGNFNNLVAETVCKIVRAPTVQSGPVAHQPSDENRSIREIVELKESVRR